MNTKTCTKCGVEKPIGNFYRRREGHRTECVVCTSLSKKVHRLQHREEQNTRQDNYNATVAGYVTRLWGSLNDRTINGASPNWNNLRCRSYLKKGIRLELTRIELENLVRVNWPLISTMMEAAKLDRMDGPSINRIGPSIHYSLDNVEFITMRENARRR